MSTIFDGPNHPDNAAFRDGEQLRYTQADLAAAVAAEREACAKIGDEYVRLNEGEFHDIARAYRVAGETISNLIRARRGAK
jgi:16S rRNA U516 pseudouridylate synthase RsuA-like enzyme